MATFQPPGASSFSLVLPFVTRSAELHADHRSLSSKSTYCAITEINCGRHLDKSNPLRTRKAAWQYLKNIVIRSIVSIKI